MSLYCIGDVHGCYDELKQLLKMVDFKPKNDELLFTGDIIGRGPKPLQVVRFIRDLGDKAHVVLGNHDINFISIAKGLNKAKKRDRLDDLLTSPNLKDITDWFIKQPLMYMHPTAPVCMVHAGLAPQWDIPTAKKCAEEMESVLQDKDLCNTFLAHMFCDEPNNWSDTLSGIPKWRYITNVFTRIRFCHNDFSLDFNNKSTPFNALSEGLQPWFSLREKQFDIYNRYTIVFGHWAALCGQCSYPHAKALDTGCVWGGRLTMWCVDTDTIYSVPSQSKLVPNMKL
jgi:bis(5'-nucleosyl)-tetraphosphatase (symmetrical)